MKNQAENIVNSSNACQEAIENYWYRYGAYMLISGLFPAWSIDLTGTLPVSVNHMNYLIVAVELISERQVARASKSADSSVVAAFLRI